MSCEKNTTGTAASNSRPLKILHVDPERNWGGGEQQVLGLITYLSRKGHENHLLTDQDGRLFAISQSSRIRTLPIRVRNDLDLSPIPALRRLIRTEKYDIVHLHTKRAHALCLWLPRGQGRPKYVVTRRMDYREARNSYTRLLYNCRVDGVVAISEKIRALLAEAGVASDRIRLIPSGIEIDRFENLQRNGRLRGASLVVGTAAVLEERKGHRFLLQAASSLRRQGLQLRCRIAGDGSLRRDLREMAIALGIEKDVEFLGFLDDIPGFLSSIDIFVLPSLHEGLGVSVLEAMAAGKPVVASRVGGLLDSVIDDCTGYLVAPGDHAALAAAIRKLAENPNLGEAMGRRGAERARDRFTLKHMAEENECFYYELLRDTAA